MGQEGKEQGENGQARRRQLEDNRKRKKTKERKGKSEEEFDLETETVIQMTNKNTRKKEEERIKKLTKEEQRRKKRKKRIKAIVKTFLLIGIILGGSIFAMVSPIFNIKNIEVINNEQVSSETIISLSGIKLEENIFRFSSSKIIHQIEENAYIETVKIHRKFPDKIQIEVKERVHNYSVDFLGKYAYINNQGYILEVAEDNKQKPLIQGITTPEEQIIDGNRLNKEDLEKLEDIIKIMNVAKEYNLDSKITSIDISDKNEYSVYLEEEKKKVHLGDNSNLSNKMLYVNAIIEEEKGNAGEIFANGDLNNKFKIYFRESLNL